MKRALTLLFCALVALFSPGLHAATITVTTTTDEVNGNTSSIANLIATPGGAGISLREAVIAANNTAGADTITLPAGTYNLTIIGSDNTAAAGDLDISDSLTILGAGASTTIIKMAAFAGNCDCKVFGINQDGTHPGLTVAFNGVTITGGNNNFIATGTFQETGGGIDFFLTGTGNNYSMSNCIITGNSATGSANSHGGGVNVDSANAATVGGASAGTATFSSCTFSNNTSSHEGGGLQCFADKHDVNIINCTFIGNNAENGGGLQLAHTYGGTATMIGGTITNNTASKNGGGLSIDRNTTINISGVTISGNTSTGSGGSSIGGGLLINELGIAGFTPTILVSGCTIANNHANNGAAAAGGGVYYGHVYSATLTNCTISGNTSGTGAGIFNAGSSSTPPDVLTVNNCTITNNAASMSGGGVANANTITAITRINNSTIVGNSAVTSGGGIFNPGGTNTVTFSRIANNTAATGKAVAQSGGTVAAVNSWWGTNSPAALMSGTVGFTPWLVLTNVATPNPIRVGNATTLTATFLTNSAGTFVPAANLPVLIGLPITFGNAVRGNLSGAQTTIQSSGTAIATFTATSAGAGGADATVDGQPVTASVNIVTVVNSINRTGPTPTNGAFVQWDVTFADAVSNLTTANFSLANVGLSAPALGTVTAIPSSPSATWRVTASTGSGSGTLGLNMINSSGVSAQVTNLTFIGQIFTVDLVPPDTTITAQPPAITNSAAASFSFTGSDTGVGVAGFQCQLDGAAYTNCTSPVNFSGLSDGSHTFNVRAVDGVGNVDASPASFTWTVDTIPPSITISTASVVTVRFGGFASFTVTYADTHFNASTLSTANITLNRIGTATGAVVVAGSGTTRTVTVTNVSGSGTLGISIAAGTATDTANNFAAAAGPSATFDVVQDDFGDAPAPYPTLLVDNGARHTIPVGGATLFLGTVPPDGETNGQPHATAQGDNLNGVNDEEGVTLPSQFIKGQLANITVIASVSGKLDAWIDWNRDGDWSDPGEQVFTNFTVLAGPNPLGIFVPNTVTNSGLSFARFRLSSAGNLSFTGQASDGEVEDYQVKLAILPVATTLAASGINADSATLNGSIVAAESSAGWYFQYGPTTNYSSSTVTNTLSASYSAAPVSASIAPLTPNTAYQFRVVATNAAGTAYGSNFTFTTAPFAITAQPVSVGACVGNTASFFVGVNAPGSATYQWQRRNPGAGAFNNILNATNANYQTPPLTAADDGAGYRAIASAPGTNITSSEALVSVISLASPTVTYDFNSGLPPNTAIYGSAFLSNGVLVLTTNGGGLQGGFLTADLAPGRVVRGFAASFKLRIAQGSGTPADGFSFNWAANLPNDSTGEEGAGSGLTVSFDIYDNGLGEAPAIDVKWNSNVVSHTAVPLSFISDFSGSFRTASIRLNSDGTVDVIYNCTPVLTHFAVPGYASQLGGRFLLGARTGGEFASHSVDDFALQLDVDPTNGVPRITSVATNGSGGLTILGTGTPGATLALNAATNLASAGNWSFRATVIPNGIGVFTFNEPSISTPPYRFYKLAAAPQLPTNLVTWWRAESNYLDSFGGNHGSASGVAPDFTNGQRGQAFSFNGIDQAMLTPGSVIPVPWTAAFWVKRQDAVDPSASLLTDTVSALKLEQSGGTRRVGFTLYNVQDYFFLYIVPTNTWTHLAFVGTPGGTILYTNGIASETNAATINLPLLILGARSNGTDHMKGLVDETTIFNRALSPAEIQQLLNATRGP